VHTVRFLVYQCVNSKPLNDRLFRFWGVYTIQQTSSNLRVLWVHLLEVCWTFAGSCKHPICHLLTVLSDDAAVNQTRREPQQGPAKHYLGAPLGETF